MKFSSDYQPEGKGRPKGSKNKVTEDIRGQFETLVQNNINQLDDDLKSMKPRERVKAIIELSRFVLPTLKSTSVEKSRDNFQTIKIVREIISPKKNQ